MSSNCIPDIDQVWAIFRCSKYLTLSKQRSLSYSLNQSVDWQSKSVEWFLYEINLCHDRVMEVNHLQINVITLIQHLWN